MIKKVASEVPPPIQFFGSELDSNSAFCHFPKFRFLSVFQISSFEP